MEKAPHIVFVPSPGMGHLIPFVEFGKRLVTQHNHNLSATFIISNDGPLSKSQYALLDSLPSAMNYHLLPPVNIDDLRPDAKIVTRMTLIITRSIPSLRETLKSMIVDNKILGLFLDLFTTPAYDVSYLFFPSSAMGLSMSLHLPKLDRSVSCPYQDLPDPIQIPGCIPIHGRDLVDICQDRNNDAYKIVLENVKRFVMFKGIVVNSFNKLEGGPIAALQLEQPGKPPVYPVGPLTQVGSVGSSGMGVNESKCLGWLDGQPRASVLYICFGSGGTLSYDQVNELAMGLEISEQRFLWVVSTPNDKGFDAAYLYVGSNNDSLDFLPKVFLKRTKHFGLVVPTWAPQAQILSHGSTGGFLTHCGWNSVLESVVHGVPMIAWPLHAEQKMNAVMLTDGLKVALRAKSNENGLVGRLEIGRVVKGLFEGEEGKLIQIRIRELKEAAANGLSKDGLSYKILDQISYKFRKQNLVKLFILHDGKINKRALEV